MNNKQQQQLAFRNKCFVVFVFVFANVLVVLFFQVLHSFDSTGAAVSVIVSIPLLLVGSIPRFVASLMNGRNNKMLGAPPSPPVEGDIEQARRQSFPIYDPHSETIMVAVIPIHHEPKKEISKAVNSFLLSELPFPRHSVHLCFVIDGREESPGHIDAVQLETTQALLSLLFPDLIQYHDSSGVVNLMFPNSLTAYSIEYVEHSVATYRGNMQGFPFTVFLKKYNKGKRDSQMFCFREMGHGNIPKARDGILIMDSDSLFEWEGEKAKRKNSLANLYSALISSPDVGGVTGEVQVSNMDESIYTICQWFEYKVAHFFSKKSESYFGMAQCLSGAFSLVRPQALEAVLVDYGLHSCGLVGRNLLDLGEDRTLTTFLLRTGWKTLYCPEAVARTKVPRNVQRLIKQRRRWINSTWINQILLLFSSQLYNNRSIFLVVALFCDAVTSFVFPALIFEFFLRIALDVGFSFYWIFPLLSCWVTFHLIIALCFPIEHTGLVYQISCWFSWTYMVYLLSSIIFSAFAAPSFWDHAPHLSLVIVWCFLLVLSSIRNSELAAFIGLVGPLSWFLMIPTLYMFIPIYAVANLNDFSWGEREGKVLFRQNDTSTVKK